MNLIIDQGNTKAKIAIFNCDELLVLKEVSCLSVGEISKIIKEWPLKNCILSSVKELEGLLYDYLREQFELCVILNAETPMPLQIDYRTPNTLGMDRIAAMAGTLPESAGKPVVVIDAGTAVTYDFMDAFGHYQGGNIAPGMEMRFKALHHFTDKLPLVTKDEETPVIGFNTLTAIRSGVVKGICYEIEGFVAEIKATHPSVLVFLTGGDAFFFAERIKCSIFVDNKLVLKGLNRILNYNVEH